MENQKNKLITILFGIYLIILIWIILFKMQTDLKFLPYIHSVNLVPFGQSVIINGKIDFNEMINNCLIFIPVGIYIEMLGKNRKFYQKIIPIFFITLFLEILQFILHIGATDITDIIMNTLGGMVGILSICMLHKIFKNGEKLNQILSILALICTVMVVAFLAVLIIVNY